MMRESSDEQGKLSDELKQQILDAETKARLEDLYLPYKPKRRTRAQIARDGVGAKVVLARDRLYPLARPDADERRIGQRTRYGACGNTRKRGKIGYVPDRPHPAFPHSHPAALFQHLA